MPELPEVETVCRGLKPVLEGARIENVLLRRKDLRAPFPPRLAESLKGRRVERVRRRAKYLLWELSGGKTLIVHLGMTGHFSYHKHTPPGYMPHDHAVFALEGEGTLIFNDARRFGLMTLAETHALAAHPLLAKLGPEPLEKTFNARHLARIFKDKKQPLKAALMDPVTVVGVGNIYASEACFEAGMHPAIPAALAAAQAPLIVQSVRKVLKAAIASGGSSLRDFWHVDGGGGYFQHRFKVYGRQRKPCAHCQTPIKSVKMAGRSTFFCPRCQAK